MFNRQRPANAAVSGSNHGPRNSTKRRLVDCAKILLDIAKESADWFPPLKSALGGVNAVIKHYEEFEDSKEKIEGLIPQLDRFKQHITTARVDGDPGEMARRKKLTSTFNQIKESSERLLKKDSITKFTDKGSDSKIVAGLIERLREAIIHYQISQQQAIYDQVTHLATSFDSFLKLQEEPSVARHKLGFILTQLDRLEDAPWKEFLHERWEKSFDDLRPLRERATALRERVGAEGYVENEADIIAVSGLAEDLRDALFECRTAQQWAIYDQNRMLIDSADLFVLNNCRRAQGAEYCHGNRRGCLKGTREIVLNEIGSWTKDPSKSPVFWLNGLAGTGKSTIAQTIAERAFAEGNLGASFFCSRDFEDRSNLQFIFPSLAFQLAHKYPDFRLYIVSILRFNPDIVHESLYSQMQRLIAGPMQAIGLSTVIVIDALDECKDDEPSSAILSVLGRFVKEIPGVKFFITGRPEPRIKTGFRLPLLVDSTDVFVLHDVHPSLINNDIRLFLKHELADLASRRRLGVWPSDEHVDLLCRRAAGLFVYAVATVKFLDSNTHLPERRLGAILKFPDSTAPEGRTRFGNKTTLDSLYTSVLQAAFSEEDEDVYSKVRTTIGTIVLVVNPLPPSAIAELMGLDPNELMLFLTPIQSLLAKGEDLNHPVKLFHKSFPDFITDPSRCADTRFCISPGRLHTELTTNCFGVMNGRLDQDFLSLPEYALNSEVEDLQTKIDGRVSPALQYACQSWHNHLAETRGDITGIVYEVRVFLEEKFLEWLEMLSVLGDVGGAAVALEKLMTWLREVAKDDELLNTARDCFHFVTKFFEPINASATHVYHSALELCPMSSVIRKLYYDRYHRSTRSPRVVIGIPDSWDQAVSIPGKEYDYDFCVWSPCGQFVAAQTTDNVEIRSQHTLELLTILHPTRATARLTGPLTYSPDGSSLACASDISIVIWDVQTGGVVKEISCGANSVSLVWSLDCRMICTIDGYGEALKVRVYDVVSGAARSPGKLQLGNDLRLWAHGDSFRIITTVRNRTTSDTTVEIFEAGAGHPLTRIQSFSFTRSPTRVAPRISFSHTARRVSVAVDHALCIFEDCNSGNCLLEVAGYFLSHCFSFDGSLFAASEEGGVRVWKYASGRYVLWKEFRCQDRTNSSLQFSPATSSILRHSRGMIQIWRLDDLPNTPEAVRQRCVGISRSGSHILTAYKSERTIAVIDIRSQAPAQSIDSGVEIEGLVVTANVLLVMGSKTLAAWLLTEEGLVGGPFGGTKVDHNARIWTISLSRSESEPIFRVGGGFGEVEADGGINFSYHVETGEIFQPKEQSGIWRTVGQAFRGRDYVQFHYPYFRQAWGLRNPLTHLHRTRTSPMPMYDGKPSGIALPTGWAVDPEGKCRLWLPVEWRVSWDRADWLNEVTTQFSILRDEPLVVKF